MSFLRKELNPAEKRVYIGCLAYLLHIDKKPGLPKIDYLQGKVKEVGLTAEEFKKLKPLSPQDITKQLKDIKSVIARRYIMRDMIMLATADHELSDKEVDLIYGIGVGAGVTQDKIDDLFMWAAQGISWQIEGIRLIEEDI